MKSLFSVVTLLAFTLYSCASIPVSGGENTSPENITVQSTEESVSTETSSETSIEVIGGDEESLREFIRQWIVPIYPYPDGTSQDVTVYIGRTPEDVPYDLPTPDDARIIGSVTGNWFDYMLIYDTSLTADAVHDFYVQALADKGWKEAPTGQGSGFTSQSELFKGYCYGENEAYLNVETPSISADTTGIRLNLDVSPDSYACNAPPNTGMSHENLIPRLEAPQGVFVQGGGAGSSDRDANISANLKGDVSAAEIADFYNKQLLAAGWNMQDGGDAEGTAWSRWAFQDDEGTDWSGALMVVEVSTESNTLFAVVTIEKNN